MSMKEISSRVVKYFEKKSQLKDKYVTNKMDSVLWKEEYCDIK